MPPSQAKYVTAVAGSLLDFIVDIRVGSPTFGQWDAVLLDTVDRRAVYLSEGLGHAFCALEDDTTVIYLCSAAYSPSREHGIHPLDPELGLGLARRHASRCCRPRTPRRPPSPRPASRACSRGTTTASP